MKNLIFILSAVIGFQAQGLETADYSDMAKNRSYVGGAEEGDLKVLPEAYFQKNKKNSSEEVNEGF